MFILLSYLLVLGFLSFVDSRKDMCAATPLSGEGFLTKRSEYEGREECDEEAGVYMCWLKRCGSGLRLCGFVHSLARLLLH